MAWPIDETYTLSRQELEGLLGEACWKVIEDILRVADLTHGIFPGAMVEAAVQEALDSLFLHVQ